MPDELVIRRITTDDNLDALVDLTRVCFANAWTRDMFLGELGNPTVCAIFGAFGANRDLLGYCSVWFVADELHINHIGVAPVHRRRGIARRLLVAAINDAVALGASHATLEVRISNHAARRLYEGFGFQMRAIRPRYYDHPVEDALIFWHENLAVALGPQPDPAA